ncbi:SGNH/GDSL hydrolase family protein [Leifsonia sp. Leaf264]|uniref:SGNH/GDSL hydrolase family protein n=1 Tax=Leifsonia sp. Leaf264 TaxID=1736314 RepID=UPI0006F87B69|nr:GDSL-type esterase/lipase family protein [Leifsonia sp. Leaf264]KQO95779.1 hypothetical protein ASF30_19420 [Leifsonia sp. Leaf264]
MSLQRNLHTLSLSVATAAVLVVSGLFGSVGAQAATPPPGSMAALGDSITQALDSCGYKDCPANSWSTGTSTSVVSHASRLRSAGATTLVVSNDAVSGSTSASLLAQAQKAVAQKAQYVTIEIGANDACTPTVAAMTPVATYEANVRAAVALIATSLPSTRVFVASVPNLKTLWAVNKGKLGARLVWASARICQSMLARPTSTSATDTARRDAVQQRVTEFNAALVRVCASFAGCSTDRGALAGYAFTSADISTLDYFHPSVKGQARIAALTWPVSPYAVAP